MKVYEELKSKLIFSYRIMGKKVGDINVGMRTLMFY